MTELDADIIIVGCGPIGQAAAALLGQQGHRVLVYECHAEIYQLPRAVTFDDEIMRFWQSLGIVDEIIDDLVAGRTYDWFGADGAPIVRMKGAVPTPSGWEPNYNFFQPYIEQALVAAAEALPTVTINRGWLAEGLERAADHVALRLRRVREKVVGQLEPTDETATVRARYLVGADGANSIVRSSAGIELNDLGFAEPWLVIDLLPIDRAKLAELPAPCQWCDPARPHMTVRNGRQHHRFEFMLLPHEQPKDFDDQVGAWELLAPWLTPADARIIRHAVYVFRSRLARTMRADRVLLVGDAAHTMPPFLGQGLCSGVRDAAAVAWRLDLILRGLAGDELLDSYTGERYSQNEWIVHRSIEMGQISCELDPEAAAKRDVELRRATLPRPQTLPPLSAGVRADQAPLAGTRGVQGTIRYGATTGRFDDVVGRGFVLLSRRPVELSNEHADLLDSIAAHRIALEEMEDLDGRLTAWIEQNAIEAVVIRPDFYVFGVVDIVDDLPALLDELQAKLHAVAPPCRPRAPLPSRQASTDPATA